MTWQPEQRDTGCSAQTEKNTAKLANLGRSPNQTIMTTDILKTSAEDTASNQDGAFMKENDAGAPSPSDPQTRT